MRRDTGMLDFVANHPSRRTPAWPPGVFALVAFVVQQTGA